MRETRPGYWQVRAFDTAAGKQVARGVAGGKRDAQRTLTALLADIDAGKVRATSRRTVAGLLDAWLAHLERVGRSPTTLAGYRSIVAAITASDLAGKRIDRIGGMELDGYYADLVAGGRTTTTAHHYHAVLHAAFAQAIKWRLLTANPADQATVPTSPRQRASPPTSAAVRLWLDELDGADRRWWPAFPIAVHLLVGTGMRRGEVCGLQWQDVDGDTVTVRRSIAEVSGALIPKGTKTGAQRRIVLPPDLVERLAVWRAEVGDRARPNQWVLSLDVTPPRPGWLTQGWRRLVGPRGPRLHELRHFHASELLAAGVPITTVSGRLGHANPATTMAVYAHMLPAGDRAAADAIGEALARPVGALAPIPAGPPR
jgi:integrase